MRGCTCVYHSKGGKSADGKDPVGVASPAGIPPGGHPSSSTSVGDRKPDVDIVDFRPAPSQPAIGDLDARDFSLTK